MGASGEGEWQDVGARRVSGLWTRTQRAQSGRVGWRPCRQLEDPQRPIGRGRLGCVGPEAGGREPGHQPAAVISSPCPNRIGRRFRADKVPAGARCFHAHNPALIYQASLPASVHLSFALPIARPPSTALHTHLGVCLSLLRSAARSEPASPPRNNPAVRCCVGLRHVRATSHHTNLAKDECATNARPAARRDSIGHRELFPLKLRHPAAQPSRTSPVVRPRLLRLRASARHHPI